MRGRKRPHSGNNRAKISAVSTVGGGASIIRKNKRVTHNATLTSVAASNDNDEVLLGHVVDDDADEMVVPMLSASGPKSAMATDAIAGDPEIKLGGPALDDEHDDPEGGVPDDFEDDDPGDLKIEEVEFMEEDSEKLILVITGDQDDQGVAGIADPDPDPIDHHLPASAVNSAFAATIGLDKNHGEGGGKLVVGGGPGDPDKSVPEPFADVVNGEAVYICPSDCSYYSRQAKDMSSHISSIHKTPMAFDRLAPVVFESVHLEYVDCTYCEDQCFRDVTLSYKAQSSNPTGKSVRRTVRQCKRCGMESATKNSMITLNQHVDECHAGMPKRRVPKREVFALPILPPDKMPARPIIPNHNATFVKHESRGPLGSLGGDVDDAISKLQAPLSPPELGSRLWGTHSSVPSGPPSKVTSYSSNIIQFICTQCGQVYNSHGDLAKHLEENHGPDALDPDFRVSRRSGYGSEGESPPKAAAAPPDTTMNLLATVDAASGNPVKVAAVPIRESYKGTWKNKKKMPKIVNAFNPVCPHCNYQTINIKDWNHHYTSCTLKYSK